MELDGGNGDPKIPAVPFFLRSDTSTLDDYGNVVAKRRAVGRAIIQWMKGRASTVELNDATVKFYRKQKLPKMTLFQAWIELGLMASAAGFYGFNINVSMVLFF
jgi:hypothetical protein